MHIWSPVNAIEDVYITLEHFVKIKIASKMAHSRFIMEMPYYFQICIIFCFVFLKAQAFICQKMVDVNTVLSFFNVSISKNGVKDGYQKYIGNEFGYHHVWQSAKCIISAHFITNKC